MTCRLYLPCLANALKYLYDLLEVAHVEYRQDKLDMSEMAVAGKEWLVACLAGLSLA